MRIIQKIQSWNIQLAIRKKETKDDRKQEEREHYYRNNVLEKKHRKKKMSDQVKKIRAIEGWNFKESIQNSSALKRIFKMF